MNGRFCCWRMRITAAANRCWLPASWSGPSGCASCSREPLCGRSEQLIRSKLTEDVSRQACSPGEIAVLVEARGAIPGAARRVWTQALAATRAADALLAGAAIRPVDVIPAATEARVGEPRGVPVADAILVSPLEAPVATLDARVRAVPCAARLRAAQVAAAVCAMRVQGALPCVAAEPAGTRARVLTPARVWTPALEGPAADAYRGEVWVAARRREQVPDGQLPDEPPALDGNLLPAEPGLIVRRSPAGFPLRFAGGRDSDWRTGLDSASPPGRWRAGQAAARRGVRFALQPARWSDGNSGRRCRRCS